MKFRAWFTWPTWFCYRFRVFMRSAKWHRENVTQTCRKEKPNGDVRCENQSRDRYDNEPWVDVPTEKPEPLASKENWWCCQFKICKMLNPRDDFVNIDRKEFLCPREHTGSRHEIYEPRRQISTCWARSLCSTMMRLSRVNIYLTTYPRSCASWNLAWLGLGTMGMK